MHGGDGASGGDPSIGRRRHVLREVKNKPIRNHTLRLVTFVRVFGVRFSLVGSGHYQ